MLTPYNKRQNELTFNPFREMDDLQRLFFSPNTLNAFKTDIRDAGDEFLLEADLPGFRKEDIQVDLNDGTMTITAQRHSEFEEKDKKGNYLRQERSYGSFSRSFDTDGINTEQIKAGFDNGVLTLHLPKLKKTAPQGRRLEIE